MNVSSLAEEEEEAGGSFRPTSGRSSGLMGSSCPPRTPRSACLTHGLHYASAVFEGERAYGGAIFKCTEHSERLKRSANILDFEIPYLGRRDRRRQAAGGREERPARTPTSAPIAWRGSEHDGRVGAEATRSTSRSRPGNGRAISIRRSASRASASISPSIAGPIRRPRRALAKAAGLYMICTISKHRAERKGYADAMMLDWQGRVAECTGANIFFVKDGKIHTPIADCFLDGITRRDRDRARQEARHRGDRAAHHAGRALDVHRVLHHRHGGGSHGGVGDRRLEVHAGRPSPSS